VDNDPDPGQPSPPLPVSASPSADPPLRLARLKPEYASRYAGLDAGAWYPAASLAAYFRAWMLRHPDPGQNSGKLRGLETAHFEFKGGVPREPPWLAEQSPEERQTEVEYRAPNRSR
jgi:hypothetical protein